MPGYRYRGTNYNLEEPPPKPKPAPKRKNKTGRTRSNHPSPCGTPSAYTRHRRLGEPVDDACRVANAAACKARYHKRKAQT